MLQQCSTCVWTCGAALKVGYEVAGGILCDPLTRGVEGHRAVRRQDAAAQNVLECDERNKQAKSEVNAALQQHLYV